MFFFATQFHAIPCFLFFKILEFCKFIESFVLFSMRHYSWRISSSSCSSIYPHVQSVRNFKVLSVLYGCIKSLLQPFDSTLTIDIKRNCFGTRIRPWNGKYLHNSHISHISAFSNWLIVWYIFFCQWYLCFALNKLKILNSNF